MTKFIKKGDTYHVTADTNLVVTNTLPVDTYTICFDPINGYYLQQVESYELEGKLYGDVSKRCDRILKTFSARQYGTGLLLSGEKGCGKTMLAKLLAMRGQKAGMPTIVINNAWHGEAFNQFIQSIDQPCVILFDEFEKVYHEKEHQESMLTLLDGVYPTKKLFVLTTNSFNSINYHMLNRPGRLFYSLEYTGLSPEFVEEYARDNLKNKKNIEGLVNYSRAFQSFNFDMLKALVEEMNRYNETVKEAAEMMNVKAHSYRRPFNVKVKVDGKPVKIVDGYESIEFDPFGGGNANVDVYLNDKDAKADDALELYFNVAHLKQSSDGEYVYEVARKVGRKPIKAHVFLTPATTKTRRLSYDELALAV